MIEELKENWYLVLLFIIVMVFLYFKVGYCYKFMFTPIGEVPAFCVGRY